MPAAIVALRSGSDPVWLFTYGSLMWSPDFAFAEAAPAVLRGYRRSFCLYSYDYRGTRVQPGLVLGLDRGGSCRGIAFRLAPTALAPSIDRVWAREMGGGVYEMRRLPLRVGTAAVAGYAFVVRRTHPDYAGHLSLDEAARLVLAGQGSRGSCLDYLETTVRRLDELGLADAPLRRLAAQVRSLVGTGR